MKKKFLVFQIIIVVALFLILLITPVYGTFGSVLISIIRYPFRMLLQDVRFIVFLLASVVTCALDVILLIGLKQKIEL